jgi:hypothetical protein
MRDELWMLGPDDDPTPTWTFDPILAGGGVRFVRADLLVEKDRLCQAYYNEASEGWSKFRAAERELAALRAYADHTYYCGVKSGKKCDCGYDAVLQPNIPVERPQVRSNYGLGGFERRR